MKESKVEIEFSSQAAARLEAVAGLVMSHDYSLSEGREQILQAICSEFPEIDVIVTEYRMLAA